MVLSEINNSVSYQEIKRPYPEDVDTDVDLYTIRHSGLDVIIATGMAKHTFKDSNIVFFPIYMLTKNNKFIQIGVYELRPDEYLSKLDKNNNLDVVKMNDPIIYSFVSKKMLQDSRMLLKDVTGEDVDEKAPLNKTNEDEIKIDDERVKDKTGENADAIENDRDIDLQEDIDDEETVEYSLPCTRKDLFVITTGVLIPSLLEEETEESSKQIKAGYTDNPNDKWINHFFKNHNYSLVDNEGGGDCFFATIRDSFSSIAQQTSVNKLRVCLSREAKSSVFDEYKTNYDM